MDVSEISIPILSVATIVCILVGAIWRSHNKKLSDVSAKVDLAATKAELAQAQALAQSRSDIIEARFREDIRELRGDMNGIGERLEKRLDPLHQMLTALLNGGNNHK